MGLYYNVHSRVFLNVLCEWQKTQDGWTRKYFFFPPFNKHFSLTEALNHRFAFVHISFTNGFCLTEKWFA